MRTMSAFYELALALCEMDPENDANFTEEVAESLDIELQERYCVDFAGFENLASELAKYVDIGQSPINKQWFRGFGNGKVWYYKRPS